MLELAILGLLKDQPLHGYELKKRLTEMLGPLSSVSFGSLYPALGRLERTGAVEAVDGDAGGSRSGPRGAPPAAAPTVPMTGSIAGERAAFRAWTDRPVRAATAKVRRGGRTRKVYAITPDGEAMFRDLLAAENAHGDEDRVFNLRLAFARHLPPEARLGLLERRRALLVERLARTRSTIRAGRERLDTYSRSLMEHGTETTERDISWLDRLIADERAADDRAERPAPGEDPASVHDPTTGAGDAVATPAARPA